MKVCLGGDAMKKTKHSGKSTEDMSSGGEVRTLFAVVFFSGVAGLIYQVLWMKQLGLLFGNTSYAVSATLSAFFAGLAAGSWFWGRRVGSSTNPLRLYALLEAGIAVTALVYFVILHIFYGVYPFIYQSVSSRSLMLLVKFALSLLLIFPPAFCMGGTVPVIAQHLIRNRSLFGRTSAMLYGINTLGAACGAGVAVFVMVLYLGFTWTCVVAILISVAAGGVAWRLSIGSAGRAEQIDVPVMVPRSDGNQRKHKGKRREETVVEIQSDRNRWPVALICFLSGFGVLALEVLWTRMFAQVHSNSVYAFTIILVVVLTCLAIGAFFSSWLARMKFAPRPMLAVLTMMAGGVLTLGPALFMNVTDDLQPYSSLEPWSQYMPMMFIKGFAAIGIVVIALGTLFPFIMKTEEAYAVRPGQTLGRLLTLNTAGSILGALLCGFVFLRVFGMWRTMQLITAMYLVAGFLLMSGWSRLAMACRGTSVVLLFLLFTLLDPTGLPTTGVDPRRAPAKILETWEGSDCTVSVVEELNGVRSIKINSAYTLGSMGAYGQQVSQSVAPLTIFPDTRSIFFLGLGTGISAGASFDPTFTKVERVVSCELVPEVIEAAKRYMPGELTGGIFTDPRSTILVEDGRHYLMASDEHFDMINADLFLPYRRGAGSLYSLDHYSAARKRLTARGVYVQWLPLYQITELEFGIITRTMLEAFSQVTMWRNTFEPGQDVVALIGQNDALPLQLPPLTDDESMIKDVRGLDWSTLQSDLSVPIMNETIAFFYCGNVTVAEDLFEQYPVNTDDMPLIEYLAPRTFRKNTGDPFIWFVGPKIAEMTDKILARCPVDEDPVLRNRPSGNRRLPLAGAAFHRARFYERLGDFSNSRKEWSTFTREWSNAADGK